MNYAGIGRRFLLAALLMVAPSMFSSRSVAMGQEKADSATSANDAQIQADITKQLSKSQFKSVKATVQNGVISLSGTVDLYDYKEQADKKAHRVKNVVAVRNQIDVGGKEVPDQVLGQKLAKAIAYDRVGYGTTPFNAITIAVENGVVTLGGHAYGPVDKDSAIGLVSNTPGVKDVIDDIDVDPVSPMDDRTRQAVYRAVYGYSSLNKYAIDPAKSIRITVINGNVILSGVVDSQADKDTAFIRANGVPGVFKVTNDLIVANQPSEKKSKNQ
jgi:hyperosmotically inducible periplasmic protein